MTEALIGLFGVLITALVAFLGHRFQRSIDIRNELIERNAEDRMRLETALKAIEIIKSSEADGKETKDSIRSAILVIASLSQYKLAYVLLEQYWIDGIIESRFYCDMADLCMKHEKSDLPTKVFIAISDHPTLLLNDRGTFYFPKSYFLTWDKESVDDIKEEIRLSVLKIMLCRRRGDWKKNCFNQFLYFLFKMTFDSDSTFSYVAALYCKELLDVMGERDEDKFRPPDIPSISYGEIRSRCNQLIEEFGSPLDRVTASDFNRKDLIEEWYSGKVIDIDAI